MSQRLHHAYDKHNAQSHCQPPHHAVHIFNCIDQLICIEQNHTVSQQYPHGFKYFSHTVKTKIPVLGKKGRQQRKNRINKYRYQFIAPFKLPLFFRIPVSKDCAHDNGKQYDCHGLII